jgi:hypothetical protein
MAERSDGEKNWASDLGASKVHRSSDLKEAISSILAIFWHLFPSSVIITFYDLIFVFSTLPDKREYFEIHVHKKCTKLTPVLRIKSNCINVSGTKKNSIRSWAQLYCCVKKPPLKSKISAIFYSLSALVCLMSLFDGAIKD